MSTVSYPAESRVVIDNVRWSTYLALLEDTQSRRGRMTYDQGVLEIMSPSKLHEKVGCLLGRMVEAFTEEMQIEIESTASTTIKREAVKRGFEADESYYIQNAGAVRDKDEIDPAVDPPPDLVIEVDISRSSFGKLPIYATFCVPEVWRYDGETLRMYVLYSDEYAITEQSVVLPQFPRDLAVRIIEQRAEVGENALIRQFREWVRANLRSDAS